jgi:protein phosphatase
MEDAVGALTVLCPSARPAAARILIAVDGVGGQANGEVASATALQEIGSHLVADALRTTTARTPAQGATLLREALSRANDSILQQIRANPSLAGMATTAVCALMVEDLLTVAWAGDSRCYVHSGGELRRLTRDHSEVQELLEAGILHHEDAKDHPLAHVITRYLGQPDGPGSEETTYALAPGDIVMLCTDGLTDAVDDEEIAGLIRACNRGVFPFEQLARLLVAEALKAGTLDNVTVLCCRHDHSGSGVASRTVTERYASALAKNLKPGREVQNATR